MLKSRKPRIGVTGPDKGGTAAWLFTALCIKMAGGVPVRIRPSRPRKGHVLDGLVLGGGADVDPRTYTNDHFIQQYLKDSFATPKRSLITKAKTFLRRLSFPLIFIVRKIFSEKSHKIDEARDHLEFKVLDQAVKKNLPVLGICRGAQLLNIYFKGTLYKDISPFYSSMINKGTILPIMSVKVEEGSKLESIVKAKEIKVNALHRQAVKEPGKGIRIVAWERNGIVQGIEGENNSFLLGVQWHPEYLFSRKEHLRIFETLVQTAAKEGTMRYS